MKTSVKVKHNDEDVEFEVIADTEKIKIVFPDKETPIYLQDGDRLDILLTKDRRSKGKITE